MPDERYNRIDNAIDLYASMIDRAIARSQRAFFLDLSLIIILPVVATVIAGFFSNIAGLFTTLGVGTVNAGDKLVRGKTILLKYWSERAKLENSVNILRLRLRLCDATDDESLNNIEQLLRGYIKSLQ